MMRTSFLIAISVVSTALLPAQEAAEAPAEAPTEVAREKPKGLEFVNAKDLERHTYWLADEERGGRHTATRGQFEAADYIAKQFAALGFEPLGDSTEDGPSWMQSYKVGRTRLDPQGTALEIGGESFATGFGVLPARQVGTTLSEGRVVYVGRGARRTLPDQFDAGDVPLVLLRTRSRPNVPIEAQFMMGLGIFSKASRIAAECEKRGAPTVLFAMLHDDSGLGEMLNYAGLVPGKPLLTYGSDAGMAAMVAQMKRDIPQVFLASRISKRVLEMLNVDLETAEAGESEEVAASIALSIVEDETEATNVVGLLRGSDPELADEAIVFSAHMDHVGGRLDEEVFNGADDNASGSAGLLEVAEAFAKGDRPKRSVIFLSVSGEELGLWGSDFFSKNPTWPLKNIIANVNIDMIGRATDLSGESEISITPSYAHPKYSSIARTAAHLADEFDMGLTIGDKYYTRSDHYNFAEKGVPVVFFCDGEHVDYHQVSDTPDKLDYRKMEKVARLAYWTGFRVANADGRPEEIGKQPSWK